MTFKTIFAYIDPGSGALLSQMCIAAVLGLLFYLKKTRDFIWQKLSKLLRLQVKHEPAKAKTPPAEEVATPGAPRRP
jgi:hypothetical protein